MTQRNRTARNKPGAKAPTPQQQALAYTAAGLRVMPISMPAARPAVPADWYGRDRPDACAEPSAFRATHHVGILCGRTQCTTDDGEPLELCGLDRDGDAEWSDLERALGLPLPPTLSSKGDRHRYYWLPAGHGIRQINGLVRQIDMRCDHGGYLREPWEWDSPRGFALEAIELLDTHTVEALRTLRGMHDQADDGATDLPEPGPVDDDLAEALIAAAVEEWPAAGQGRHTCSMALGGALRRAGADRESSEAIARAVVETVQSPPQRLAAALDAWDRTDRGEPAYGRHTLAQLLLDGGAQTLEALAAIEKPDPWAEAWCARLDARASGGSPATQVGAVAPTEPASAPSDADALAALPLWVRAHVLAAQEELRTPLALNIANAIGALGAAVSGRLRVRLHEMYAPFTCLFVCSVAEPGENKSAAFSRAMQPIQAWEAEQTKVDAERYTRARVARSELEDQVKHLERERKRGFSVDDAPAPSDDLLRLHIKLAEPPPIPFRAIVGDVTSEKLADMLAQHGSLLCLSSDAGKIFSVLAGQYSGGSADLSVWLEAYDGRCAPVDRLGREAERPRHAHTALSCVLSTQPSVLDSVANNPNMTGQGFVQRFCWVVCASAPRRWARGERPQPMSGAVAKAYGEGLDAMLAISTGTEVRLSTEAEAAYIAFRDDLEDAKLDTLGGDMRGWGSKHLERTTRIAGNLWAADGAKGPITSEQFARAVTIGRWLVPHAVAALVGGPADAQELRVLDAVAALGGPCTFRQIARKVHKTLKAKKVLEPLLDNLEARGLLQRLPNKHYVRCPD